MWASGEGRSRAVAAFAVLAVILGGGALMWTRATPHSDPAPKPVRSAGGKIYDKWCADCHSTATGPGSIALQRKYGGDPPAVLEQRSDMNSDYVRLVVRQGMSFMPSFRKTEISDAELALLGAYVTHSQETGPSSDEAALSKPAGSKRK